MKEEYIAHARIFRAFCDENRLRVLELLRDGERCACDLKDHMEIGQPALSYHMKLLVESGIVESRQEGKWTYYRISAQGARAAGEILVQLTTPLTAVSTSPVKTTQGAS